MSILRTVGGFALLYVFGALFIFGVVYQAIAAALQATIQFTIPILGTVAKMSVTFGVMGLGLLIVIRAPHVFKLIGLVLVACGFFWACIAGFF